MFDEEMKTKYQELTPSPNLRERVVSEEFASCPHRKRGGAGPWTAAACLALLVLAAALPLLPRNRGEMSLLYNGGPVGSEPVSVSGEGPIPRALPPPSHDPRPPPTPPPPT